MGTIHVTGEIITPWGIFYTPKGLFVDAFVLRCAVNGFEFAHQSCFSYFYKSVLKHVQENRIAESV